MKKKKQIISKNYLEKIPIINPEIAWNLGDDCLVTLAIENKGAFNRIAQALFKRPKISYVHLDKNGSFIWQIIDGENDIIKIGEAVKEQFGDKAEPLYERLATFFKILESYKFISFRE